VRLLGIYRRNWLLPGLQGRTALKSLAEEKGFRLIKDQNLTPYLRLGRPRDKAISLLVRLLGPLMERDPYLRSLLGGDAKQKCYLEGLIDYRLLVFEKRAMDAWISPNRPNLIEATKIEIIRRDKSDDGTSGFHFSLWSLLRCLCHLHCTPRQ
jgi:hypothetical protein